MATSLSKSVFISYARNGGEDHAVRLSQALEQRGYEVFLDRSSITGSQPFVDRIEKGILESSFFIAILTKDWEDSRWVSQERQLAFRHFKPVFPLLFDPESNTNGFIGNYQIIEFIDPGTYAQSLEKLYKALETFSALVHADPAVKQRLNHDPQRKWRQLPAVNFGVYAGNGANIVCVTPDTKIDYAHYIIRDVFEYRIRHLLVTTTGEVGGQLLGQVGLRQILKQQSIQKPEWKKETVKQIMDRKDQGDARLHFMYLHDTDTLETAIRAFNTPLLRDEGTLHWFYMSVLPIVDATGNAVGLIGFKDVLGHVKAGNLPMPKATVGSYMSGTDSIYCATGHETVIGAKNEMLVYGQRDLPIVNNRKEFRLSGLVPDHILVANQIDGRHINQITITTVENLRNQFVNTPIEVMLKDYVTDESYRYLYSVPVIEEDGKPLPILKGLIGYRDVFRAMIETC